MLVDVSEEAGCVVFVAAAEPRVLLVFLAAAACLFVLLVLLEVAATEAAPHSSYPAI